MSTDNEKRWLVTGGSRGIGHAIAAEAVKGGARVAIVGRSETVIASAAELSPSAEIAMGIQADVSSPEGIAEVVDRAHREFGEIDVLVNNAAIHRAGRLQALDPADFEAVIGANLSGPFRLIQALLPYMTRPGAIVNIGAVVGERGFPGDSPYGSAKAGLAGLTRVLATELAPEMITVNQVVPGFTETEMTRGLTRKVRDRLIAQVPLGRAATPAEVAEVVWWVAGSRYMTGSTVHVDGGLAARL